MLPFLPFLNVSFSSDPLPPTTTPPPPPLPLTLTPSHDSSALPLMHHSWFCSLMHFRAPPQPNHQIFIGGFYELFQRSSPHPPPLATSRRPLPLLAPFRHPSTQSPSSLFTPALSFRFAPPIALTSLSSFFHHFNVCFLHPSLSIHVTLPFPSYPEVSSC